MVKLTINVKYICNLGSVSMETQIGFFCSPHYNVILSSGNDMIVVMTTNNDTKTNKGFLAAMTAGIFRE